MVVTCLPGMRSSIHPVSKQNPALSVNRYWCVPRSPDFELRSIPAFQPAEAHHLEHRE
jgi:hypothetical protein